MAHKYKLQRLAAKMAATRGFQYGKDCRHEHIIGAQITITDSCKVIKVSKRYRCKNRG